MATAISGCIIARENDNGSVDYYEKCEDCGHTSSGTHHTSIFHTNVKIPYRCPKCGSMQVAHISK